MHLNKTYTQIHLRMQPSLAVVLSIVRHNWAAADCWLWIADERSSTDQQPMQYDITTEISNNSRLISFFSDRSIACERPWKVCGINRQVRRPDSAALLPYPVCEAVGHEPRRRAEQEGLVVRALRRQVHRTTDGGVSEQADRSSGRRCRWVTIRSSRKKVRVLARRE